MNARGAAAGAALVTLSACQLVASTDGLVAREDLPRAAGQAGGGARAGQEGGAAGQGGSVQGAGRGGGAGATAGTAGTSGGGAGRGGAGARAGIGGASGGSGAGGSKAPPAGGQAGSAGKGAAAGTSGAGGTSGKSGAKAGAGGSPAVGGGSGSGGGEPGGGAGAAGKSDPGGNPSGATCSASNECVAGLFCLPPVGANKLVNQTFDNARTAGSCGSCTGDSRVPAGGDKCYFSLKFLKPSSRKEGDKACTSFGAASAKFDSEGEWTSVTGALPLPAVALSTGHSCSQTVGDFTCHDLTGWESPKVVWLLDQPASIPKVQANYCGKINTATPRLFEAVVCDDDLEYALCQVRASIGS